MGGVSGQVVESVSELCKINALAFGRSFTENGLQLVRFMMGTGFFDWVRSRTVPALAKTDRSPTDAADDRKLGVHGFPSDCGFPLSLTPRAAAPDTPDAGAGT
jgi:hypothetical protein